MSIPLYFIVDFGTGEPNIVDLNQDSTLLRDASGANRDADHLEMSLETELFLTIIH